jgi:hypothetical protein
VTRRSGDRTGPSPVQHAEARAAGMSDRLQADIEAARAVLRELHEAVQDGRALLKEWREVRALLDANLEAAWDKEIATSTAVIQKWHDENVDRLRASFADMSASVERCEDRIRLRFAEMMGTTTPQELMDLIIVQTAEVVRGQMSLAVAPEAADAFKSTVEFPGGGAVTVRTARPGEQPGLYLGDR